MKIKKGFVLRSVGGENIAVPVGELSKSFHGMITLNETGAFLWNFFAEEHTEDEGVEALCGEYEVDNEIARADVKRFMETISEKGLAE